ncbi:MAG: hypothetical protein VKQ33_09990 [Candidatus Sericytochromatia bacterium]|nr:hypothetical protein [Candidatus Sericytochromatia bacterium]
MSASPLSAEAVQAFLEALDEAGEALRDLVEDPVDPGGPAMKAYLDGAAFLEAGYLMVEQLSQDHPHVFLALHDHHYLPALMAARKGRVGWSEALTELPEFLRDYASERAAAELEGEA